MADELKKLFPGVTYKLEDGSEVAVSPIPFGKLTVFSEAVTTIISKLQQEGLTEINTTDEISLAFKVAFEEVLQLMMMVLKKDREWFDTISTPDGLGLATIIVEQNFGEKTKKNAQALLEKFKADKAEEKKTA